MYYLYSFLNFIEEKEMKKIFLLSILVFATGSIFADGHTADEKQVLKALAEYFDARNDQDWEKAVTFESKAGTYNTNSDGLRQYSYYH